MGKGGVDCNMDNDNDILSIDSPKTGDFPIGGPWFVVQKVIEEHRAVVALEWDGAPCLGKRYFTKENGRPTSRGYPIWEIIPKEKEKAETEEETEEDILKSLDGRIQEIIGDFLGSGETKISGEELSAIGGIKNTLALLHVEENFVLEFCYNCYRNLVKNRNDKEERKKETQKCKDARHEIENKCAGAKSEAEIQKIVEEVQERHFG
jgi:hypothetical protein